MKTYYYDLHVFFSRNDGYSIPIALESIDELSEYEVIELAIEMDLFQEDGDQNQVDYVLNIDEVEYNQM